LPETLSRELADAVRLNTTVSKVSQTNEGWILALRQGSTETFLEHSAVIYAGTAFKLAELNLETEQALSLKPFSEIRYSPVASIVLGFRREDVRHPCEGFGMLIPKAEGFQNPRHDFLFVALPKSRSCWPFGCHQLCGRRTLSGIGVAAARVTF
jgi:oxygen-dependent protoporphyrinogen oxidase